MTDLEGYRSRAPRLRLAALVLVGLVVATMLAFTLMAPDPTVVARVGATGRVCVQVDGRTWESQGPVLPTAAEPSTLEGRWRVTGDGAAELTTPTGTVIPMRSEHDPRVHMLCRA